jgi:DeoR family transcriptional regulator of aga operon
MSTVRQRRIERLLNLHGECGVEMLAGELGVSGMTVRRDLQALAAAGRIVRTHGGAAPVEQVMFEFQFLRRSRMMASAKQGIAQHAAGLVQNGRSVLLDSGTTTLELARHLRDRQGLTVVTACLPIASALQHAVGVKVLLLGGFVRRDSADLGGALTEMNLDQLRVDLAFLGADGVDVRGNVYNESPETTRLLIKMAAQAEATYVLADSSKIGRTALMRYGNAAQWRGLLTDTGISPAHLRDLKAVGVQVILCGASAPMAEETAATTAVKRKIPYVK